MQQLLKADHAIVADAYHGDKGLDAMLQRADINAVLVLVPIHVLAFVVQRCLAANKHVLSEKPVAHSSQTAFDLISWRSKNAAHLFWRIAENYRLNYYFEGN